MPAHERFRLKTLDDLQSEIQRLGLELPISGNLAVLGEPVALGPHISPNRFCIHPMEGFDAESDGSPGELAFRRYERYARGASGLIWFEATAVVPEARTNPHQFYLHHGSVDAFRRLVEMTRRVARESGCREPVLVLQLTHSGRYSKPEGKSKPLIAHHSAVLDPPLAIPADLPVLSDDYIDRVQDAFVEAARLAMRAGFDGVDAKSCHRYLISELLASFTREGKYGGSFDNRTRFLRDTLARIKAEAPGLFITVRLNVYDAIAHPWGWGVDRANPAAPDLTEPIRLIRMLVELGIPVINISMGNPYFNPHVNRPYDLPLAGQAVPDEHPLEGVVRLVRATHTIQQALPQLPVVGSGYAWLRHHLPAVAAGIVESGGAALIGQGRGAFAYPDSPRDILTGGRMDPLKCCVACSRCTEIMRAGGRTGCVIRDAEVYGPEYRKARPARG